MIESKSRVLKVSTESFDPKSFKKASRKRVSRIIRDANKSYLENSDEKFMSERRLHQHSKQLSSTYLLG